MAKSKKRKYPKPHTTKNLSQGGAIENAKKTFEKNLKHKKYDRNEKNYSKIISKVIYGKFQRTLKIFQNHEHRKDIIASGKMTDIYFSRRTEAYTEYASKIAEIFEDKFENINIEDELASICSMPLVTNLDELEDIWYISTAISIFILDALRESRTLNEAIIYIPSDRKKTSAVEFPYGFNDSCHSTELIQGMIFLITNRNDDVKPFDDSDHIFYNHASVKRTTKNVQPFVQTKTPDIQDKDKYEQQLRKEAASMTCRERLDKILSYIHEDIINKACDRFEDKMIKYTEKILFHINKIDAQNETLIKKAFSELDRLSELSHKSKSTCGNLCNLKSIQPQKPDSISIFSDCINPLNSISDDLPDIYSDVVSTIEKILEYEGQINSMKDNKYYAIAHLLGRECINADVSNEVREEYKNLTIENPYEICFAAFYLLDTGSNLPWLIELCGAIIDKAALLLPWYIDPMYLEGEDEDEKAAEPIALYDYTENEKDTHSPDYTDYFSWIENGYKRVPKNNLSSVNLPQIIYYYTGYIMPRNTHMFDGKESVLKKSGFTAKQTDTLKAILSLAECAHRKARLPQTEEPVPDDDMTDADLQSAVTALRSNAAKKDLEISSLKRSLHHAEKKAEDEHKKYEKLEEEYSSVKQELNDLRELVFNLQNDTEPESDKNDKIQFPYTVTRKVISVGGHASWQKAIKQLLPNVIFIDPFTTPDSNLIRNADVLWFQTNAINHSLYYKLLDISRQRNITVRYFSYASAEKCAEQVVMNEEENEAGDI